MRLEKGVFFIRAPRFPIGPDWEHRLSVNSGIIAQGDGLFPRQDWCPPSVEELACLLAPPASTASLPILGETPLTADGPFPTDAVALLSIPDHLRSRWWEITARGEPFDDFGRAMAEYLRFKGVPLPPMCSFAALAVAPGQPSTRGARGLAEPEAHTLGEINLGDEPTTVVFLNLPCWPRVDRFVERFGDYPLVRLTLYPGEGYWLPMGGLLADGSTLGKQEVDVRLRISRQA
jgi:hypothetical protein